ncbi:MAG: aspartate aminotransferase family protein, partial [Caldilineaceae bacterium]|nr:aspartate aminotransferase family protein [Caldilineaceae bacterium]
AKGVTSGYLPLGGIQISDAIRDVILSADPGESWMHGFTYSGHAAACAVGLRNIEIIEREGLIDNARLMGLRLAAGLQSLRSEFQFVDNIRGKGLLWGIEIVADRESGQPDGAKAAEIANACMARGLRARNVGAATLAFSPPLSITADEIDTIITIMGGAMDAV